jgi:hypothetical protein
VYFEVYRYVYNAIAREKELKRCCRDKRVRLVESINPTWEDLAAGWFPAEELARDPNSPAEMKYDPSLARSFSSGGEGGFTLRRVDPVNEVPAKLRRRSVKTNFSAGRP